MVKVQPSKAEIEAAEEALRLSGIDGKKYGETFATLIKLEKHYLERTGVELEEEVKAERAENEKIRRQLKGSKFRGERKMIEMLEKMEGQLRVLGGPDDNLKRVRGSLGTIQDPFTPGWAKDAVRLMTRDINGEKVSAVERGEIAERSSKEIVKELEEIKKMQIERLRAAIRLNMIDFHQHLCIGGLEGNLSAMKKAAENEKKLIGQYERLVGKGAFKKEYARSKKMSIAEMLKRLSNIDKRMDAEQRASTTEELIREFTMENTLAEKIERQTDEQCKRMEGLGEKEISRKLSQVRALRIHERRTLPSIEKVTRQFNEISSSPKLGPREAAERGVGFTMRGMPITEFGNIYRRTITDVYPLVRKEYTLTDLKRKHKR
ncbi:MAG: hypothetical protein V1911_00705 [Candidatus Micrarchaeota archaeon]